MEVKILKDAKRILNAKKIQIVRRLLGGMSNYTYVIEADGILYTFRQPGEHAQFFVDRTLERRNIHLIEQLGVTNETIYLNTEDGQKIAYYVEGTSLNLMNPEEYPLEKVAEKLKVLHQSDVKAVNDYSPFKRLTQYEQYIIDLGYAHPEAYLDLKNEFLHYQDRLESYPKVLCHGDSQPSNFVYHDGDVMIVDFEFCGNNDLFYDLACFSNMRKEDGVRLMEVYFDRLESDHWFRFFAWRTFQCFQWYNVAVFKELKGLSLTLHVDFKKVAENYLEKTRLYFNEMCKYL